MFTLSGKLNCGRLIYIFDFMNSTPTAVGGAERNLTADHACRAVARPVASIYVPFRAAASTRWCVDSGQSFALDLIPLVCVLYRNFMRVCAHSRNPPHLVILVPTSFH
jgi:hypothetical protein